MLLVVKKSNCKYLKDLSYYNHNLYELPFQIDECNVVEEVYDESWNTILYNLGILKNRKFISYFQVDSECNQAMCNSLIAFNALISS